MNSLPFSTSVVLIQWSDFQQGAHSFWVPEHESAHQSSLTQGSSNGYHTILWGLCSAHIFLCQQNESFHVLLVGSVIAPHSGQRSLTLTYTAYFSLLEAQISSDTTRNPIKFILKHRWNKVNMLSGRVIEHMLFSVSDNQYSGTVLSYCLIFFHTSFLSWYNSTKNLSLKSFQ